MATASKSRAKKPRQSRKSESPAAKQIDCERLIIRDSDGNARIIIGMFSAGNKESVVPAIALLHDGEVRCDMRLLDDGCSTVGFYGPGPERQLVASISGMFGHGFIHLTSNEDGCCDPGEVWIDSSGASIRVKGKDPRIVCDDDGGQTVFDATNPTDSMQAGEFRVAIIEPEHGFEPKDEMCLTRGGKFLEFLSEAYEDSFKEAVRRVEGYNRCKMELREAGEPIKEWAVVIPPGAVVPRGRHDRHLIMQSGCYSH